MSESVFSRPYGTQILFLASIPALKCWAKFNRPYRDSSCLPRLAALDGDSAVGRVNPQVRAAGA